jgi:hypothetical protein
VGTDYDTEDTVKKPNQASECADVVTRATGYDGIETKADRSARRIANAVAKFLQPEIGAKTITAEIGFHLGLELGIALMQAATIDPDLREAAAVGEIERVSRALIDLQLDDRRTAAISQAAEIVESMRNSPE